MKQLSEIIQSAFTLLDFQDLVDQPHKYTEGQVALRWQGSHEGQILIRTSQDSHDHMKGFPFCRLVESKRNDFVFSFTLNNRVLPLPVLRDRNPFILSYSAFERMSWVKFLVTAPNRQQRTLGWMNDSFLCLVRAALLRASETATQVPMPERLKAMTELATELTARGVRLGDTQLENCCQLSSG